MRGRSPTHLGWSTRARRWKRSTRSGTLAAIRVTAQWTRGPMVLHSTHEARDWLLWELRTDAAHGT
jgi:hypothetical protein